MKHTIHILLAATPLYLTSCAAIGEAMVDSLFSSIGDSVFKSSTDKKIDSDTKRMRKGEPLKHYPSERRLRLAREDRMFNEMMNR